MRYLKYVLFLIVCWPVVFIQGQSTIACTCDTILDSLMESQLAGDLYLQLDRGVGSQYFTDEWLKGEVYLSNKTVVRNKYLKYNQYLDKLMWLTPANHQQIMLDKEPIEGFCISNNFGNKYYFQKIPIKVDMSPDSLLVFGEVLYQNKISLYAYRKVILTGYEVASTGSYYKNIYTVNTIYFFMLENGRTIGFKKYRKHNIIQLFPDKKDQIVAKLKELKQRHFRNEADLKNITKVLNEVL
jgi:hypothetical protein